MLCSSVPCIILINGSEEGSSSADQNLKITLEAQSEARDDFLAWRCPMFDIHRHLPVA